MENTHHLDQNQLSQRWNISTRVLEHWRQEGIGPLFLKLHGQVRYKLSDIEQYEKSCLRKSTSERALTRKGDEL